MHFYNVFIYSNLYSSFAENLLRVKCVLKSGQTCTWTKGYRQTSAILAMFHLSEWDVSLLSHRKFAPLASI